MRKLILLCTLLCAMVLLNSATPVHAQAVLWVSATGNDANACSTTAPCATFQGAINKGSVSQINCLNSGNYGAFTITASITVDCGTGNVGSAVVGSNSAITINAPAGANVVLRHLSLNGLGTAVAGIKAGAFPSGSLIVEDCMIQGFRNAIGVAGIYFAPTGGRGLLQVSNTQLSNNYFGIFVAPDNTQIASVTLNRVELVASAISGLQLGGTGVVAGTMRDSLVSANGLNGVESNAGQVYFTVEQSSIVANLQYGIETNSAGSVLNVGGSTIGGNGTGVKGTLGQLISFGNNQISANGSNGNFTSTTTLR